MFTTRIAKLTGAVLALVLATTATAGAGAGTGTGARDRSFGGTGYVKVRFAKKWSSYQVFRDVLITYHGKVVGAGFVASPDTSRFAVARRRHNGVRDARFSSNGKVTTSFEDGASKAFRVVAAGQGRILVGGIAGGRFALARYERDGRLDATFGGDGKVTTDITPNDDVIHDIVVDGDTITVAGIADGPPGRYGHGALVWARYTSGGDLDPTFGTGGIQLTTEPLPEYVGSRNFVDVVLQSDGKLVAGGHAECRGCTTDIAMLFARYDSDGALDDSFGGDGVTLLEFNEAFEETEAYATAVAIAPNNKIVAAGYTAWGDYIDFAAAQLTADGQEDWLGGGGGGGYAGSFADGVAVQNDGKVLVTGHLQRGFALVRYTEDGRLDSSFSRDGWSITRVPPEGTDRGYAVTVRGQEIVAGGETRTEGGRHGFKEHGVLLRYKQ